jgi:regulatory protein
VVFRRTRKALDPGRSADPDDVRAAAVALLARRDFAGGELAQKLQTKGYDREAVAAVIHDLADSRILDDARYAANYVAYHAGRGQGPQRIAADLRTMELAADLIQAALDSGPDWRSLARELRSRRFGPGAPGDWPEKARQARFLQYRGFSSDHIRAALGADVDSDLQT